MFRLLFLFLVLPTFAISQIQVVCDGNSLTDGYNSTTGMVNGFYNNYVMNPNNLGGMDYPAQLNRLTGGVYTIKNYGLTGQTTGQMINDAKTEIDPLYNAQRYKHNILVAWEITNDVNNAGLSWATAYNNFKNYCLARKAAGWEVVVLTVLPRQYVNGGDDAGFETGRQQINDLLRKEFSNFADGIADVGDLAIDRTDYVHPSDAGYGIIAAAVKTSIEALTKPIPVLENTSSVTVVKPTGPLSGAVKFSLIGGEDLSKFTIQPSTGELDFAQAAKFEVNGDNVYEVLVRAENGSAINDQVVTAEVFTANSHAINTFYPRTSATDLCLSASWTTDELGGDGASPLDFASPNQLFIINSNIPNPVLQGHLTISGGSNITINNTNGLILAPSATLNIGVGSMVDFNNQPVILKSDNTGSASIGNISGTLTGASNVTVERYISNIRSYRLLSPSVNTTASIHANWQEGASSKIDNPTPGYGTHITGATTDQFNGFDGTLTGQPSLFTYNATTPQWVGIASTSSNNLDAKTGYLLYVRGDRTPNLLTTTSSTSTVLRATGNLLIGEQVFSNLTSSDGFNLVTNPYACAIDWSAVYNDGTAGNNTGLDDSYIYWDPNVGTRGGFVSVKADGTNSGGTNATSEIQSGQAFFVKVQLGVAAPALTIRESHKSLNNNISVFRTGVTGNTETFRLRLYYNSNGRRILADGAVELFSNDYSPKVDGDDAEEIANFDENIAILRDGKFLSIEGRPLITSSDTIPVAVARLKTQNYEWQFDPSDFSQNGLQAYLVDKFLGTRTAISLAGSTVITFTVTSDTASTATDRFSVVFSAGSTLPVNMGLIKAYTATSGIQIEWLTIAESNMDRYEVERSVNGSDFISVGSVTSKGTSSLQTNYKWLDANPTAGVYYYRIKSINKSGTAEYSQVVRVSFANGVQYISVYPNPITNKTVNLKMVGHPKGDYKVILVSQLGQKVFSATINHSETDMVHTLTLNNSVVSGIYELQVIGNDKKLSEKIIIADK